MENRRRRTDSEIIDEYSPRFGALAVGMGLVTPDQLKEALAIQVDDDLNGRPHRLLGTIFFNQRWITFQQMQSVLNELFKRQK